jgi:hypothetical protein
MQMNDKTMGERMSSIEAWITGHEALCAERYGGLKSDLRWLIRGVFGMLIGIVAWLAVQLWNGRGPAPQPPPVTVLQSQTPQPTPARPAP